MRRGGRPAWSGRRRLTLTRDHADGAAVANARPLRVVAAPRRNGHGPVGAYAHRRRCRHERPPRLQDRVHPRLPEPAGASHADPTRAPQGRTATRPRPVRPLRPTGPTGSARLRTPNRRGELPASHPRSYHLLADSGDRSCFERGGLGCGRSQLRVTVPYQPDRVGQRPLLYGEYQLNRSLVRSERLSV